MMRKLQKTTGKRETITKRGRRMPPLFARWFLSYVRVLLPMVLLCTALLVYNAVAIEGDFQRLREMELETVIKQYEQRMEDVKASVLSLYINADLRRVVTSHRPDIGYEAFTAMERVRETLANLRENMPYCDTLFLYLNLSGYMIEPTHIMQMSDLYTMQFKPFDGPWRDALLEEVAAGYGSGLLTVLNAGQSSPLVLYTYALSSPYNRQAQARVVAVLQLDRLLMDVMAEMGTNADFALYANDGALLAASNPEAFEAVDFSNVHAGAGLQRVGEASLLAGELALGSVAVRMTRGGAESPLARQTALALYLVFSAALIGCVCLGYFYARRHYHPVREMLAIIDESGEGEGDEYDRMHQALLEAVAYRSKKTKQGEVWEALRKDAELMARLGAEEGRALLLDRLQRTQQSTTGSHWCAVELSPIGYSLESKEEERSFFQDVLIQCKQMLWDYAQLGCACIAVADNMRILLFARLETAQESQLITLKYHVQEAVRFLRENDLIDCRCCFSGVIADDRRWEAVYRQMLERIALARHAYLYGADAPEAAQGDAREDALLSGVLQKAHASMHAGDYAGTRRALQQAIQMLPRLEQPGAEDQEDTAYGIKRQVMDIIHQDYTNPDLNVTEIAVRLGRNPDALSRAFRVTTHIGILEYIHYVRIRAAKELLITPGEMTIKQISRICGYGNIDSFMRIFKRVEGTTPGKFREQSMRKI